MSVMRILRDIKDGLSVYFANPVDCIPNIQPTSVTPSVAKSSFPLMGIAVKYGISYGDALLYFDAYRIKKYENTVHEREATRRILNAAQNGSFSMQELDYDIMGVLSDRS